MSIVNNAIPRADLSNFQQLGEVMAATVIDTDSAEDVLGAAQSVLANPQPTAHTLSEETIDFAAVHLSDAESSGVDLKEILNGDLSDSISKMAASKEEVNASIEPKDLDFNNNVQVDDDAIPESQDVDHASSNSDIPETSSFDNVLHITQWLATAAFLSLATVFGVKLKRLHSEHKASEKNAEPSQLVTQTPEKASVFVAKVMGSTELRNYARGSLAAGAVCAAATLLRTI